ncbi:MAG: YbaK/EbsC family protein [Colwellia sp.]|nr:YbaK/EbsC family protein [Colwellia sp.]
MAISISFNEYLSNHNIDYELVKHRFTKSSFDSSCSAHLPSAEVAKAIILQSSDGSYLMSTLSVGHKLSLAQVNQLMGKNYHLLNETQLSELFPDCEQGAIPGIGAAFAIDMLVDDGLLGKKQVYIEAGDHRHLIKVDQQQFANILANVPHGNISGEAVGYPKMVEHLSSEWRMS